MADKDAKFAYRGASAVIGPSAWLGEAFWHLRGGQVENEYAVPLVEPDPRRRWPRPANPRGWVW